MLRRDVKLDWKDAVLFALGFAVAVGVLVFLSTQYGMTLENRLLRIAMLLLCFGPLAARRAWFGQPTRATPKEGLLWSVVSILALLLIFGGVGSLGLSLVPLSRLLESPPDFEADAPPAIAPTSNFDYEILDPNETPEARDARLAREAREAQVVTRDDKPDVSARSNWEAQRARARTNALLMLALGLGLIAVGTLLMTLRNRRT